MFTRREVFQLKADSSAELTRVIRGDIPPVLRHLRRVRQTEEFLTP